jgi:hypothetical protein
MIATTAFVPVEANSALPAPCAPLSGASPGASAFVFTSFQRLAVSQNAKAFMDNIQHTVGKYLVSPLIKNLDDGRFAAAVSIRSGRGSGMHDRVMRFTPHFGSHAAALRYAVDEGLHWVRERTAVRPAPTTCAA